MQKFCLIHLINLIRAIRVPYPLLLHKFAPCTIRTILIEYTILFVSFVTLCQIKNTCPTIYPKLSSNPSKAHRALMKLNLSKCMTMQNKLQASGSIQGNQQLQVGIYPFNQLCRGAPQAGICLKGHPLL